MKKNRRTFRLQGILSLICVMLLISIFSSGKVMAKETKEITNEETNDVTKETTTEKIIETTKEDHASLRFIFTTDLHGMISSVDYEAGTDYKNAGLARAYDLILQTKSESPEENVYLFDIGDVLYDATTEYILDQDSEVTQPLYLAMSYIGYDAITLGNHEFDYGKEYLLGQLNGAHLMDKVVVSNLFNSKDDTYPFKRNMIITREVTTANGKKATVKVGIIGETIPTLSPRTDNYKGTWKTEDIVANVTKEAALLKEQGADVIVVLSHSGFGVEEPEEMASNASYALTKIEDVDVVLCGHEHHIYPGDPSQYYYSMSGVDKETGLVNGKTIVMASNQGRSIGVADVTLDVSKEGEYHITSQKGSVRKVADYKTKERSDILAFFDDWKEEFEISRSKVIAELAKDTVLESYFGLMGDTVAMQLQNDARIAYALKYLQKNKKEYLKYPIIAASSYVNFGANSYDDYVNISGKVTQSDLVALQKYRQYTGLYSITGAQLKEWIEWSASAYAQTTTKTNYKSDTLNELAQKTNLSTLLSEEWLDNWTNFYVFDGIGYTISPSIAARYDVAGNKIRNTNRVVSLTYNGVEVKNDQVFVIACNTLASSSSKVHAFAKSQLIYSMYRTQNIIAEYLEVLGKDGLVSLSTDNNWILSYPTNYQFLVKASNLSEASAKNATWYQKTLQTEGNYNFYTAKFDTAKITERPTIIIMPSTMDPIKSMTEIYVTGFAKRGLKALKYMSGDIPINATEWNIARDITNQKFTAYFNGTYSIYAEDNEGNKTIQKVIVDNINAKGMAVPKVKTFNNRSKTLYGTAEANTSVVIETPTKTYTAKVTAKGTFSCNLEAQPSGTEIFVYAKDEETSRQSDKVKIRVKKAGPNQPVVNEFYNNDQVLTGNCGDDDAYTVAIVEELRTAYVAKGAKDILLSSSDIDLTSYKVVEVNWAVDGGHNFLLMTPEFEIGTSVTVYNLDHVGRLSRSVVINVQDGGAYAPTVYNICDIEKQVNGKVTSSAKNTVFTVYAVIGNQIYKATSAKNGQFSIPLTNAQLKPNQVIEIYAEDNTKEEVRRSRSTYVSVLDTETLQPGKQIDLISLQDNATKVTAVYTPNELVYISIPTASGNHIFSGKTDASGYFSVNLTETLKPGAKVYALIRFDDGNIVDIASKIVPYPLPRVPNLYGILDNTSTEIVMISDEYSSVTIYVNWKSYTSNVGVYNEVAGGYLHTFKIDPLVSGSKVSAYTKNPSYKSEATTFIVEKKVPDAPVIHNLVEGATTIEGTVDVFLKGIDAPTVESTKTQVFIKTWKTTYEAVVNDDGTFTVTLPKVKAGAKIIVWATNADGVGTKKAYWAKKAESDEGNSDTNALSAGE